MESRKPYVAELARTVASAAAEILWPTRCALCDMPGEVLCERCSRKLPYLDWWRACRKCGSPYGLVQCDACNPVALARIGRESLAYEACASAVEFDGRTGRIVRVYKDQGERRLADFVAGCMFRALPPDWPADAVAFVPATLSAFRYRGFDHAQLIAERVAGLAGLGCAELLQRPKTRDQRQLSATQRIANLKGRFQAKYADSLPPRILLVDDVYTTGATLSAASDALHAAGVREVRCLTFARV